MLAKGSPLTSCVDKAIAALKFERHARPDPDDLALRQGERARPPLVTRDRTPGGARACSPGRDAGRSRTCRSRVMSTVVVFVRDRAAVVNSPGWETVKHVVLQRRRGARRRSRSVARAFVLNVKMFLIAEVLILPFALVIAVLRSLPGPVFFPLRLLAIVYTDFFRGVPDDPGRLPARVRHARRCSSRASRPTRCSGASSRWCSSTAPTSPRCTGPASSRSTRARRRPPARSASPARQTLRYVIVPQAVRRVIPPLLNDFIGLQKDTALVSVLGLGRRAPAGQHQLGGRLQLHAVPRRGLLLRALTIPLARFTDWLIARERRRRQAGGRV